jgi:DNA cross-link repair 1A protein
MAGSYGKKASTPSKSPAAVRQSSVKRNSSILSFFQKTDTPPGATSRQSRITQFATTSSRSPSSGRGTPNLQRVNSSRDTAGGELFLEDKKGRAIAQVAATTETRARSRSPANIWGENDDDDFFNADDPRYNETDSSVKRRKVNSPDAANDRQQSDNGPESANPPTSKKPTSGPFIDESDSEEDMDAYKDLEDTSPTLEHTTLRERVPINNDTAASERSSAFASPNLVREETSHAGNDEPADFDDLEEDEFVGEEFRERPWEDEEQEVSIDGVARDSDSCSGIDQGAGEEVAVCPICQVTLPKLDETVRRCSFSMHEPCAQLQARQYRSM